MADEKLNKNFDDDEDLRAYYAMQSANASPAAPVAASSTGPGTNYGSTTASGGGGGYGGASATTAPPPPPPPPPPSDRPATEADIMAHYASMSAGLPGGSGYNEFAYPKDFDVADKRFGGGLRIVPLPNQLKSTFGNKFGWLLYHVDDVNLYFKGFFSESGEPRVLFVTPLFLYFANAKTGEICVAREISDIAMINILGEKGVGMRASGRAPDLFFKTSTAAARSQLVETLKILFTQFGGKPMNTVTGSSDREKSYRKEIRFFEEKEHQWFPKEDPRTGLPLVEIPEQHAEMYAPLIPKSLHWFGGVNQTLLDNRGEIVQMRRGCWLTPTCLFLSDPNGPMPDGRQIRRCVAFEFIKCLVDGGKPGVVGIISGGGPPQPDLAITFDSDAIKRKVIFIIERCYFFRSRSPLFVRPADSLLNAGVVLAKEKDFKPTFFAMKTREDLYGLLRAPVKG